MKIPYSILDDIVLHKRKKYHIVGQKIDADLDRQVDKGDKPAVEDGKAVE